MKKSDLACKCNKTTATWDNGNCIECGGTTHHRRVIPGSRPICKHGKIAGTPCRECHDEEINIRRVVNPIADEFWDNRGDRDLSYLMLRAYKKGQEAGHKLGLEEALRIIEERTCAYDMACEITKLLKDLQ